jgi:hypothetical protein
MASRLTGRWSSSCTLIGTGSRPSAFSAATKYAADLVLQILIGLVHDHRVDPTPAITASVLVVDHQQ